MSGPASRMAAAVKAETAEEVDWHAEVERCSKLYSIEEWMQPRSMVQVQLAKLKEETRCPMCFGKIRSARISMVCLHRYCAKCIEQYLRAKVPGRHGDDKECPVCRAHLHSRRATKPDLAFDKIIKALYGDVDKYDEEEEALIAQDNKAHVAQWQAQLAEMKARQAAAVAAARAASLPGGQATDGSTISASLRSGTAAAAAAGSALGDRKRSWSDLQQQQQGSREGKLARTVADRAATHPQQQQQQSRVRRDVDADDESGVLLSSAAAGDRSSKPTAAAGAGRSSSLQLPGRSSAKLNSPAKLKLKIPATSTGAAAAGRQKKKPSARDAAARLLGMAARAAAAAAQPPRCCLVQLQPANKQLHGSKAAAAAAAAGAQGRQGRGRKQPSQQAHQHAQRLQQQWQEGQQRFMAPEVDQPYLMCPINVTVGSLKGLLLQQLRQQGALEQAECSLDDVQLLLTKPASGAGSSSSSSSDGVLADGVTMGQLYEQWWGVGPDMHLQYRLLVK